MKPAPSTTPSSSCTDQSAGCIQDLRTERSRFPTCRTGYGWLPFVVSCGAYDGVEYEGVDSARTYYFDHSDGHLVGLTNTGLTTLVPCEAFDPSFEPTQFSQFSLACSPPPSTPGEPGGGRGEWSWGVSVGRCKAPRILLMIVSVLISAIKRSYPWHLSHFTSMAKGRPAHRCAGPRPDCSTVSLGEPIMC